MKYVVILGDGMAGYPLSQRATHTCPPPPPEPPAAAASERVVAGAVVSAGVSVVACTGCTGLWAGAGSVTGSAGAASRVGVTGVCSGVSDP